MNRTQRDEAILAAGREGVRRRLIDEKGVPERVAVEWLMAWEAQAARQGARRDADYWRHGTRWIFAQLDGKRPSSAPPTS
jgi:hypothetical protein